MPICFTPMTRQVPTLIREGNGAMSFYFTPPSLRPRICCPFSITPPQTNKMRISGFFFFYLGALWGQGCLAGIAVPHVDMCRWGRFNQKKKKQEERSSQAIGPRKGWAYGYPHSSPPCCFEHAFSPGSEGTEMCLVLPRGGLHTQIWNTVAQTFGSSNRYWKSTRREI